MSKINTKSGNKLSWLGIGSYGIGGRGHRDAELTEVQSDEKYLRALMHQFEKGCNFSEISIGYGHGNASRLFSKAISESGMDRKDLFLTNSIYPRDYHSLEQVVADTKKMYEIFNTDYFDSTLVTQSLTIQYGYENVINFLKELLRTKKTRYVSLSNAGTNFIKKFKQEFKENVFAHETHLSFEVRVNQDAGIFDLCNELGIENIIWRPLRRNDTFNYSWKLLKDLSLKYKKTQNQIVLNWINHLGLRPMVMTSSIEHIDENWLSTDFIMDPQDYKKISDFRIPNFTVPKIDWEKSGNGIGMADFACRFDEFYKEQTTK